MATMINTMRTTAGTIVVEIRGEIDVANANASAKSSSTPPDNAPPP